LQRTAGPYRWIIRDEASRSSLRSDVRFGLKLTRKLHAPRREDIQAIARRGTNVKKLACLLASISLAWGHIALADEFQKVQCDSDIPKALIGQHTSNERVVVLEKKYRALV
jgi:hypothetical protein